MIFELAQHVQKYLHEHNKPSYSSFYEEMISRHQEKIQYEMQERQLKEDKERQVIIILQLYIMYMIVLLLLLFNLPLLDKTRYYKMKFRNVKKH